MKRGVILAAALALAVAIPAGASTSPGAFLKQWWTQGLAHQWAQQWKTLHPAQQKLVPKAAFIACSEENSEELATLTVWKVIKTFHQKWPIAGTKLKPLTFAVKYRFTAKGNASGQTHTETFTQHVALVNGRYRWIMGAAQLAACKTS